MGQKIYCFRGPLSRCFWESSNQNCQHNNVGGWVHYFKIQCPNKFWVQCQTKLCPKTIWFRNPLHFVFEKAVIKISKINVGGLLAGWLGPIQFWGQQNWRCKQIFGPNNFKVPTNLESNVVKCPKCICSGPFNTLFVRK